MTLYSHRSPNSSSSDSLNWLLCVRAIILYYSLIPLGKNFFRHYTTSQQIKLLAEHDDEHDIIKIPASIYSAVSTEQCVKMKPKENILCRAV